MKKASFHLYLIPFATGLVLTIAGIFSIGLALDPDATGEVKTAVKIGGLIAFVGFITLTIGIIFSLIFLHRAWKIIQLHRVRTTPQKAIGFLFIPFFSLYWIFPAVLGWAQDWNRATARLDGAPKANEKLFKVGLICLLVSVVPVIGSLTFIIGIACHGIMVKQICNAVNFVSPDGQI